MRQPDPVSRMRKATATQVIAVSGGKGGGRPDMAQAGGTEPAKLAGALASVKDWVGQRV